MPRESRVQETGMIWRNGKAAKPHGDAHAAPICQSEYVLAHVAQAGSRSSGSYPGLLASLGFAVLACVVSPAWAQSLGTAANFGVLGGSTVTNTGPTVVTGSVGVSPGTSITGFPPGIVFPGSGSVGDPAALQAQSDLTVAYNDAAGLSCPMANDLSGLILGSGGTVLTLVPGVYCFSAAAQLTGTSS